MKKRISACTVLLAVAGQSALAAPTYPPAPAPTIPQHLQVGTRMYDGSVSGLSDYMDDLSSANPAIHKKLSSDFERLKSKSTTANIMMAGGIIGGTVLGIGGATFLAGKEEMAGVTINKTNTGAIFGGIALIGVGAFSGWFFGPSRKDYLKFMNKHNEINPNNQMKLELGLAPTTSGGYMAAQLHL